MSNYLCYGSLIMKQSISNEIMKETLNKLYDIAKFCDVKIYCDKALWLYIWGKEECDVNAFKYFAAKDNLAIDEDDLEYSEDDL